MFRYTLKALCNTFSNPQWTPKTTLLHVICILMVFSFNSSICLGVMHTLKRYTHLFWKIMLYWFRLLHLISIKKHYLIFYIYIQRRKHIAMKCFVLLLSLKIRTFINLTTKTSTRKGGDDRISLLRQPHSNFFHIRSKPMMKKVRDFQTCITFQKFERKKFCDIIFSCSMWCQTFNNDLDKTPLLE